MKYRMYASMGAQGFSLEEGLGGGTVMFAQAHQLQLANILAFTFDGNNTFSIKVISSSQCRAEY
jgi:hypothetical protein